MTKEFKDVRALVRAALEQQAAKMIARAHDYGAKYGETFDTYWKGARDEANELAVELRATVESGESIDAIIASVAPSEPVGYADVNGVKGRKTGTGLLYTNPSQEHPYALYAAPVVPVLDTEALLSVVRSVAAEGFHGMPQSYGECRCSRCELIREARAALREGN